MFLALSAGISIPYKSTLATEKSASSQMQLEVEAYIKGLREAGALTSSEKTSWIVYDFTRRDKPVSINQDIPRQCASMVKPLVATAFFKRVEQNRISYGPTSRKKLRSMLVHSSNSATNWMMRQCGGPQGVQNIIDAHYSRTLQNTRIVEYIPTGGVKDGRTYLNMASAHDYSRFLYAMWNNKLPYANELKSVMGQKNSDCVYHGAPDIPVGTHVYDKTGTTGMLCGNMAILEPLGSDGIRYPYIMIGIIERSAKAQNYRSWSESRRDIIRGVSNLVYLSLKERHPLI